MSRESCSEYNVSYPTNVVVVVQNVCYDELSASASIIEVEDNQNLPETIAGIPLIQLFPTVEQDSAIIDSFRMASFLHDLRFFFNHLWYPWDEERTQSPEWLSEHLENRLQLYYDIAAGQIQPKIRATVLNLIEKGNCLQKKIAEFEETLTNVESDDSISPNERDVVTSDMRYLSLCELRLKLNHVSDSLTFYEKKQIRNLLEKQIPEEIKVNDNKHLVSVAWSGGSPDELVSVMSKVSNFFIPEINIRFKCSYSLEKLLTESCCSENIFLGKGVYGLKSRALPYHECSSIQGLENSDQIIITDSEEGLSLLDISNREIIINDVKLKASKVKYILIVRFGKCNLKNVKITGNDKQRIGIFVNAGAQLVADNCFFSDCSAAIHVDKDSTVVLRNCTFENNENGLEFEEGNIAIESCKFINNSGFAVIMEPSDATFFSITKGQDAVKKFQGVKMIGTTFDGNKCDTAKYY
ncbi:SHC binding and spindle associated nessun dorma isoform X2 [Lycorma delicatula]